MSAVAIEIQDEATARTEEALYAWGDECRSTSERLGLPASSGIARMIEQQRVFEQKVRARRGRSRKPVPHTLANGTAAKLCVCGRIYIEDDCPRCKSDPRPAEAQVHGTPTLSRKPAPMSHLSSTVAEIDVIVARAPGWMQQCLKLSYLWLQRDSKAAQRLRIRTATYTEKRLASVEYVAEKLRLSVYSV